MKDYYYNQMNKVQQKTYLMMKAGLESLADSFDVPRIEGTELSDIFYQLRLDCPQIFYASTFNYSFYPDSSMVKMKPKYLFDKNKIKEHQKAMASRIKKIVATLKGKSEWEKQLFIHDFICEKVTYDKLQKQYSHEIIGPLGQGVGVCEGIAKAVKILCDHVSIPAIVVISDNNLEKNIKYRHAWNLLSYKGQWYHVDATFDNTISKGEVRYDYFHLGDKSIFKDHEPLIYPVFSCGQEDHFYYKEKKLSFTKLEEVKKRCTQAIKKKKTFTFHWRGDYLTKERMGDLLELIGDKAREKEKHCQISMNWAQAVIRVKFVEKEQEDSLKLEDAYEEENAALDRETSQTVIE